MPVVTNLRNPCLKSRHWKQIETIIGQTLPPGNHELVYSFHSLKNNKALFNVVKFLNVLESATCIISKEKNLIQIGCAFY